MKESCFRSNKLKTDHKFGRSTSSLADICQALVSCALIFMPYSTAPWLQKVHHYLPYWVQGRLGHLPAISVCRDEWVRVSKEHFILESGVGLQPWQIIYTSGTNWGAWYSKAALGQMSYWDVWAQIYVCVCIYKKIYIL